MIFIPSCLSLKMYSLLPMIVMFARCSSNYRSKINAITQLEIEKVKEEKKETLSPMYMLENVRRSSNMRLAFFDLDHSVGLDLCMRTNLGPFRLDFIDLKKKRRSYISPKRFVLNDRRRRERTMRVLDKPSRLF